MNKARVISATAKYIRDSLRGESSGHDWWHIRRVWQMAKYIAGKETGADLFVTQLAALLHDVADWKFTGDTEAGLATVRTWLEKLFVDTERTDHICDIVGHVSFKGAHVPAPMRTLEGKIVQDADRLDAIGAIGIARAFAYGGAKGREMYNPETKPVLHRSFETYKTSGSTSVNHFYEKLLLLKDLMNTETAKKIASGRHAYLESFLAQFLAEWNGRL